MFIASVSETAYNRAYLASCLWHFFQIQLRWTSDTLGTLAEIHALKRVLMEDALL